MEPDLFESVFASRAPNGAWNVGVSAEGRGSAIVRGRPEQSYDEVFATAKKAFLGQLKISQAVAA